ncbi:retron Ec67 family RNA-directed DNA polymerase/endonuclease [Pantoea sp. Seng]|uniref:retron Ec67 family RNA-directed DNA polymerase/endonuclease n=1 Tax=Pantoea sp. Seng TaxID=2576761 RepID=UPI001368267A|nr:retron Ec67 family RNA-directed DNA polymerase/endonuclease [Pantoea sp. Seng]
MSSLESLKKLKNLKDVATFLGCKPKALSYLLFFDENKYRTFEIKKKSGGSRKILAPNDKLKAIQKILSNVLYDCYAEIYPTKKYSVISHGYVRKEKNQINKENNHTKDQNLSYGTITNSIPHKNKHNVLNIDLADYFSSFNLGRVRGFFIKNESFKLSTECATVLAQIACYENELPQGSPCSPIIANLISRSLDVKLAGLAKENSATYTRYVDDITISTNKKVFPTKIAGVIDNKVTLGKSLQRIVIKSGFTINPPKSRLQFSDSRQEVTGLIVNKFVNVPSNYRHTLRPMVHSLFKNNTYTYMNDEGDNVKGSIDRLNGMLSYIHYIRSNTINKGKYVRDDKGGIRLDGSDQLYADFLFYKYFANNTRPVLICEGKTDVIYLKSTLKALADNYPSLIEKDGSKTHLKIQILPASKTIQNLLGLLSGADDLKKFMETYEARFSKYAKPSALHPVIVLVDNDEGPRNINSKIKNKYKVIPSPGTPVKVWGNLLYVQTPEIVGMKNTAIEDFFSSEIRKIKVEGRTFSPQTETETIAHYGKRVFAEDVISKKRKILNFDSFKPILDLLVSSIDLHNLKK